MCGIIGKIGRETLTNPLNDNDLKNLRHRGPDDSGIYTDAHASLGHARLSIIDLSSAGQQPMESADGRFVIIYNGEVYNYIEIKENLISKGVSFHTQSDTEVVLNSYIYWGKDCLKEFRGMFSFVIWDKQEEILFTARDRCGEKPFIYYFDEDHFFFASEFKALVPLLPKMPALNPSVVDMYMHYQYAPEPLTLLQDVQKLPMAHYGFLNVKDWTYEEVEYWNLWDIKPDPSITKEDIKDELQQAVALTLRSDVDVGVALSAGIDSAGIAAMAAQSADKPLEAFCVGYPNKPPYDERDEAKEIASFLGCPFNEVELETDEFVDNFSDFVVMMDEPIADIAAFAHHAVPKSCIQKNIKVLLTGIGGDEVFWGYDRIRTAVMLNQQRFLFQFLASILSPILKFEFCYNFLFRLSRTVKIPEFLRLFFRKILACVDQDVPKDQLVYMAITGAPEFTKHMQVGSGWYGSAMQHLGKDNAYIPTKLDRKIKKEDVSIALTDLHFKTWLVSNCLSLGDRVSMAVGVETRLPLLDVRLIEKVIARRKVVADYKEGQKALLRDVLSDLLPEKTIKRRKSGFIPPVHEWIKGISKFYSSRLEGGHLVKQSIIRPDVINDLLDEKSNLINRHGLYRIILLELWYGAMADLYKVNSDLK